MTLLWRVLGAIRAFFCTLFGCHEPPPPAIRVVFTVGPVEDQQK